MPSLPKTPHDWARWLFANLEGVHELGNGTYRGVLPTTLDFANVADEFERLAPKVCGFTQEATRSIEFLPIAGNVYQTVEQLVDTPVNQTRVPDPFTVRELSYTTPAEPVPERIQGYLQAVQLGSLVKELADHVVEVPPSLFFIESPTRKIEISLRYNAANLGILPGLEEFSRDFVRTDLHREQKRDMVRAALIDILGPGRTTLGVLIDQFEPFVKQVTDAYAIFAADFSYQKVRSEVEKQNLDDTLRLNKTLADIQNQLLALPAALILSAGSLDSGDGVKNFSIVVGVLIFAALMVALVTNQKSSVTSIAGEVSLRKMLVEKQPAEVASRFTDAFTGIMTRVNKQNRTLNGVLILIAVVVVLVLGMALYQSVRSPASSGTVPTSTDTSATIRPQASAQHAGPPGTNAVRAFVTDEMIGTSEAVRQQARAGDPGVLATGSRAALAH